MDRREHKKPALNPERQSKVAEILEAFKNFDGIYKREQVDAAIELKEEVTPALIEILENALADPEKFTKKDDRYDHRNSGTLLIELNCKRFLNRSGSPTYSQAGDFRLSVLSLSC